MTLYQPLGHDGLVGISGFVFRDAIFGEISAPGLDGREWRVKNGDGRTFIVLLTRRHEARVVVTPYSLRRALVRGIVREVGRAVHEKESLRRNQPVSLRESDFE
jgi:hypothetical protein